MNTTPFTLPRSAVALAAAWLLGCAFAAGCSSSEASEFANVRGAPCSAEAACAGDLSCLANTCVPPACAHCMLGEACNDAGECSPGFAACDPPCGGGQKCSVAGSCIDQGSCIANGDCGSGLTCEDGTCEPGGECGEQEFPLSDVPPNLLVVLDRTGSMAAPVPGSGGKTRFAVADEAIAQLLSDHAGSIHFGLDLFSACTPGGCAAGTIVASIGSDPATIHAEVAATSLCNSGVDETVIGATLDALVGEPSLQDPARANAVLLVTDGQDNCGGGGDVAAAALANQPVPVKTYVVGFSGDVNAAELQAIATAGGTGSYFQADDAQALNAALQGIAGSVTSCTFTLETVPEGSLFVFFNNQPTPVAQSGSEGWSYDAISNAVTFHGAACAQIQNGTVHDIDVVFGCGTPTPD